MKAPVTTTWLALFAAVQARAQAARFRLPAEALLVDQTVPIALSGLAPRATVALTLRGQGMVSHASFIADSAGEVDVTRMPSVAGSYKGVAPMGLFWFAERDG